MLLSKKNGKTSLFAKMAVWHVVTVSFADVAILAASRDQSEKLLQQLTGYIKRSEELRKMLHITQRVVHSDHTDNKVAVMSAYSYTFYICFFTLSFVYELSRH